MSYTRPFVASRFVAYEGDIHKKTLSLAVRVIDSFTQEQVALPLKVRLIGSDKPIPFLTQSGIYCFEGIPPGDYTLLVKPDPVNGDWFFLQRRPGEEWKETFERPIELPLQGPLAPLEEVTLSPKTSYPFPQNATLVRGKATTGTPATDVANAIIRSTYKQVNPDDPDNSDSWIDVDVETQTDRLGEYVLFFSRLPGSEQDVTITGFKDGQQVPIDITIKEGSTTFVPPLQFP